MNEPQVIRIGNILNLEALLAQAEAKCETLNLQLNADGTVTEKRVIIEDVGEAGVGQAK